VRRRTFLVGVGAGLLQTATGRWPAVALSLAQQHQRVRPSDPGWPTETQWDGLNRALGGNLIKPKALFSSCVADPDGTACAEITANMRNPFYIGDQPAGTEVSGWLDAWTPAPSAYAVAARTSADVVAGVNFAREHNLRLVVKGTGHSYLGTSNAPDSLLIWTRGMNRVEVHDAFVGQGCAKSAAAQPAVSAEAGAMWIDLYDAVTTRSGRYVQGGGCTSVGVAGLVQSGGFGSFSKGFGSAAASLLEAEVVTADGRLRIANECTNADLFWALKGGGGGSWGVVTRVTLRSHELPELFGFAEGKITAQSDDSFRELIARVVDLYADSLFNPHWGEQIRVGPNNELELSMVCQGLSHEQIARVWGPFFEFVKNAKDLRAADLEADSAHSRHWWDAVYRESKGNHAMIRDPRPSAPSSHAWWGGDQDQVGAFLHAYDSLWLPATLLEKPQRHRLAEALFAASRHHKLELHFNKGLAGAPPDANAATRATATNPTVADAFVLVIVANGERPAYSGLSRPPLDMVAARDRARDVALAAAELRRIAPDAGSYVSESNYFNRSWQRDYWGTNYGRLRAIKAKYDPDGLFFVHHGVGSEDWSADGFTRLR
jgi:FAD/FMN-containing dehydrogenase